MKSKPMKREIDPAIEALEDAAKLKRREIEQLLDQVRLFKKRAKIVIGCTIVVTTATAIVHVFLVVMFWGMV